MCSDKDDLQVKPSTAFVVVIDKPEVKARFEAPEDVELVFVLADVDDEAGLDACALGITPGGTSGRTPYWSPDDNNTTVYPILRHLMPEGLHEAHHYPSIFRNVKLTKGEKWDLVFQNREGTLPYEVHLTFFARRAGSSFCG